MLNLYRRGVLGAAAAPGVEAFARRQGWRFGVGRFVAGETLADALPALRALNDDGRRVIVDVLGEYVRDVDAARTMGVAVAATVAGLAEAGMTPVVSVKPTQLGLGLDPALARDLAGGVARAAEQAGGRVCLDMEDHRYVDRTLALLDDVRADGAPRTSTVLQAYLHRTPADLSALLAASPPGSEVRIVKGAYREATDVALQDLPRIRRAFVAACETAWRTGARVNVATHDERLILETTAFARGAAVAQDRYELQLLFGVKPALQRRLVAEGHPVRVYVPIGADWYGYFSRRLAERPANAAVVVRGLFG
ncbi:MAG: proline dehydrogenase family protein [Trueperaceae bacterium]